jgi:dTMP kinase
MRVPERLPRLIVLEGIDGAGTTTQARKLVERIRAGGLRAWSTSEPTGSAIGLLCRRVLAGDVEVTPETTAHLFATDRWEHVYGCGGIIEHHDAGDIVICDRYYYSSIVYQSIQADGDLVTRLNGRFPDPGLVIFVDLTTDLGEERLAGREHRDIYEHLEFQTVVRRNYLREMDTARAFTTVVTVCGSDPEEEVHRNIWEAVDGASILNT